MVSVDTIGANYLSDIKSRIESKLEIQSYLQNLSYALDHGAAITFQIDRQIDKSRDIKYTNKFTIADLFPNTNPVDALKRELRKLTIEDYIRTVKDTRFKKKARCVSLVKCMKAIKMFILRFVLNFYPILEITLFS